MKVRAGWGLIRGLGVPWLNSKFFDGNQMRTGTIKLTNIAKRRAHEKYLEERRIARQNRRGQ